jgi:nicotinate-nucleotide adenylyltransferase
MKIALFGGTFDPVHYGHLLIAQAALETYHLDQVLFVPAGRPPHKRGPEAPAIHRLAMLKAALRGTARLKVSDWEIRQPRVVYTVETLTHFHRAYPRATLYFILGADAYKGLASWRDAKRLRSLARFVPFPRLLPFSSTLIRSRLKRRMSVRFHVPEEVERYIRAHRLYRQPQ